MITVLITITLALLVTLAYSTIKAIAYSKTDDYKVVCRLDKYSK